MVVLISILQLWLNFVFSQTQPVTSPTEGIYDACWEIQSNQICNNPFYTTWYHCHWDEFDFSCKCGLRTDNINVIYLIDTSLSALPLNSDFMKIAEIIDDAADSTLKTEAYTQMILYDENQQIQQPNIDATSINVSEFQRTKLNDLPSALNTSIQQFKTLDSKRPVLVIFDGQMQSNYMDDSTELCNYKSTLNSEGIIVIATSYTSSNESEARNIECLVGHGPFSGDSYNSIPYNYSGITFSITAKLSWDLCQAAYRCAGNVDDMPCYCFKYNQTLCNSRVECQYTKDTYNDTMICVNSDPYYDYGPCIYTTPKPTPRTTPKP
eukprot:247853_1